MKIKALLFDLDSTLYPASCGLETAAGLRIEQYMMDHLNMTPEEAKPVRKRLYQKYGGTLPGLHFEYGTDYYDSLREVHDLDVTQYVQPNPALRDLLRKITVPKVVFTNGYRTYATRVLLALGILEEIDLLIDAIDLFPSPKPSEKAFLRALELLSLPGPEGCVFFDDSRANIDSAKALGFFSVQVASEHHPSDHADAHLDRIEDMTSIPELQSLFHE